MDGEVHDPDADALCLCGFFLLCGVVGKAERRRGVSFMASFEKQLQLQISCLHERPEHVLLLARKLRVLVSLLLNFTLNLVARVTVFLNQIRARYSVPVTSI